MNNKLIGIALFAVTIGAVAWYPTLQAKLTSEGSNTVQLLQAREKPRVDVVFVLDTTGSMSGLIQTAKDKIWSIARSMASAQPTPEIRIGLVAYRDRGDAYVTRVVDLSSDLDSVHAELMDFRADGGGDTPESVNAALHDAVHSMSWSQGTQAYKAIFLVGDAPPHMDYDEPRYPEIRATAANRGIVVNTIQCGDMSTTVDPWTQIASLGQGSFFQVEQAGGAVAMATPYDEEIANLSAKLDDTRLYFGSEEEKDRMERKRSAAEKVKAGSSTAALARRGAFNAGAGGRENFLGEKELVEAVASGAVDLEALDKNELPAALQAMAPAEQSEHLATLAEERADLTRQIRELAADRDEWLEGKIEEAGGADDSLDARLYDAVREQAAKSGLEYEDGPAY